MEKLFGPDESSHVVLYTTEPLQTLRSFAMRLEYYEVVPKTSSLFLQTIAITHHLVNLVTIPSEDACFSMLRRVILSKRVKETMELKEGKSNQIRRNSWKKQSESVVHFSGLQCP